MKDRASSVAAEVRTAPQRRWQLVLFLVLALSYGYFYQGGGWNQNGRFDLVRALVEHGTARIDAYHENTGDKALFRGSYYSDKAPGTSWFGVPFYGLAHASLQGRVPHHRFLALSSYVATLGAVGMPTAAAVVLLAWIVGSLGLARGWEPTVAAAYGLGTLTFPYATLFYGHQLAAALLLAGFASLVAVRRGIGHPRAVLAGAGVALGLSVAVEYTSLLALVALVGYAAAVIRPGRYLGWLLAGLVLSGSLLLWYHAAVFGSPMALPYHYSTQTHRHAGVFMGLGAPAPEVIWSLLIGSYRGLFFSAPWLVLALPGAALLIRRRASRPEGLVCAAIFLLFLWVNASLIDWEGGWTLGPRYLIPTLPFLAICAAGALQPRPKADVWTRLRSVLVFLAMAVSVLLMLIGTAVKPEVPKEIEAPWTSFLVPHFFSGELSLNRTSFDDRWPGSARQAWNLGEIAGLDGLASLLPLLALWGFAAGFMMWSRELSPRRFGLFRAGARGSG